MLFLDAKPTRLDLVGQASGPVPAGPLAIGNPDREKPFKGDIGGLRIYNRALTPVEVEALALHEPIRYILTQDHEQARERADPAPARLLPHL